MVRSLTLLRNVGKFDNVSTGAGLPFARLTVIYAENGRGKTTISAILKSLGSGNAALIGERKRLGAANDPNIVIDVDGGPRAVFDQGAWSRTAPEIAVFDDAFVAENVCSGIEVAASHRQNLHELIVGAQGLALSAALQQQVQRIEAHNAELRARGDVIPAARRGALTIDAFCALADIPGLPAQIEAAERRLAAGRNSARVAAAQSFEALRLPAINIQALEGALSAGLPDVQGAAVARVQAHLARLGRTGEPWVVEGLRLEKHLELDGSHDCPFCEQDLANSPIIAHYPAYFSQAYAQLKERTAGLAGNFAAAHSRDVQAAFERSVREAVERRGFWAAYAEVPEIRIDTAEIGILWRTAREAVQALLDAKRAAPLDSIMIPYEVRQAADAYEARRSALEIDSAGLLGVNNALALVKEQAREANVGTLQADLERLKAVQARHDPAIAPLCDAYLQEKRAKAATEDARTQARAALDAHRGQAFPTYGATINNYLARLNAEFRVGPVDAVNNRGGSSANYTLLIDGNPVPLTADGANPCFRNTLSAGDRNTLALAFFLASLEVGGNRAAKVVVIDDPMTSLDEHRTRATLQEIDELSRAVVGTVVLSHSKPFLAAVWDQCQQVAKAAIELRRQGSGSTLVTWNVSDATVTEHDRRYAAAEAFLVNQGDATATRRVAESLRPMLEASLRVTHAPAFPPGTLLGPFLNVCQQRIGTAAEIMSAADTSELEQLKNFGNRYHHHTNPAWATELINDQELTNFTRRTLRFIKGR